METINELDQKIIEKADEIESWIEDQCRKINVPLYTSVDLRVSGHKITTVDTNIFPAGFNNLCQVFRENTANLFKNYFSRKHPNVRRVLIIPELHTRNSFYWENIKVLQSVLERVGYIVGVGLISDELEGDEARFKTLSGDDITGYKLQRTGYKVFTSKLIPDLLLINNDFSAKCPEILRDIWQPVEPPVEIGWHTRRKNVHFEFYNKLVYELANIIGIDPWMISIDTVDEKDVNFDTEDRDRVAAAVDRMIERLNAQYKERGIEEKPFVFIKSNSGTYGMAVISVSSGDEVKTLNADGRKRMRVNKGGKPVRDIVIQEGIPTTFRYNGDIVGEPVVYLVEAKVAGGFLRLNRGKTAFENLNTKGMEFACLTFGKEGDCENKECSEAFPLAYQLIARTASIAAGYEIEKVLKESKCGDTSA